MSDGSYIEYAKSVIERYKSRDEAELNLLYDLVKEIRPASILDLGCGPEWSPNV